MSNDFHDGLGPAVPLPGETCPKPAGIAMLKPFTEQRCGGQLFIYAKSNPPRAVWCGRCAAVSYEIPLGAEKGAA